MTKGEERPGARRWVPDRPTPATLHAGVQACKGCELYRDATQGVAGSGPLEAELMVVGEQPGAKEDEAGRPFVGPAGQLLDRALDEAGIDPASVYRTNVVKHFRWSGTRGKQRSTSRPVECTSPHAGRGWSRSSRWCGRPGLSSLVAPLEKPSWARTSA